MGRLPLGLLTIPREQVLRVHGSSGTGGLGMHAGAELMGCTLVPVSGGQTQRQVTLLRTGRISCDEDVMLE